MKVNAKDVAAGVLLLLLAVVGLALNTEHSLGTARRMGPGYMPMLVFWIQVGLALLVLGVGLFSGPDRLDGWAWRELFLVLASLCVFALLLERAGLLVTIAATVSLSALADRDQKPVGVLALIIFLVVLCWWVFIDQLDIRVPVLPQL